MKIYNKYAKMLGLINNEMTYVENQYHPSFIWLTRRKNDCYHPVFQRSSQN